jgi:hypothetical protein
MPGVRILHDSEMSCVFTLVDGKRPYKAPLACPACAKTHEFKTYHISLDGEGFAIVSPEVWKKLQRIPGQPFRLSNEVEKPPPQIVGLSGNGQHPRIVTHKGT